MNIKLIFFGFLLSGWFASCKQEEPTEILKMSYKKCQSIQNGYYEMTRYFTDRNDVPANAYACYFEKLKNDSIYSSAFHYKYYWKGKHKGDVIYTGDEFVNADLKDSTATIMSMATRAKEIKANSSRYPFYTPLTNGKSSPLPQDSDYIDGKHVFKFIGNENINGISCYHIQENDISQDDSTSPVQTLKFEFHFWISKSDFIPIQYSFIGEWVYIKGLLKDETIHEYQRNLLTKYEINNLNDKSVLTLQSIPVEYKIKVPADLKTKDSVPNDGSDHLSKEMNTANWQLNSLNDEKIALADLKGKPVLVEFFYKSCIPCIKQFPALQALHTKYKNKGLRVIGINTGHESQGEISAFLSKQGATFTILTDGEELSKQYRISAYPTVFLYDKFGTIIYTHLGYNQDLEKILEELILKNL